MLLYLPVSLSFSLSLALHLFRPFCLSSQTMTKSCLRVSCQSNTHIHTHTQTYTHTHKHTHTHTHTTHTHTHQQTHKAHTAHVCTCIKHHTVQFVTGVGTAVISAALYPETLHKVANNNTNCRHTHMHTHTNTHTHTQTHTCHVWRLFLKAIIRHMNDSQYHRVEELLGELKRTPCQIAGGDYNYSLKFKLPKGSGPVMNIPFGLF